MLSGGFGSRLSAESDANALITSEGHGPWVDATIPQLLVKDNIATEGLMETTAGSLALVRSRVPGDAPLIQQLGDAGAVILGKANLYEWANYRGDSYSGWSARGGFTRRPYVLSNDPSVRAQAPPSPWRPTSARQRSEPRPMARSWRLPTPTPPSG